jgi:hypothetical protein
MFPRDVALVQVSNTDDLATLLDRADREPLVLERNGVRYVLNREDVDAYFDPAEARSAMRSAGKVSPETAEAMIEAFEESRGRPVRQAVGS